MSSPAPSVARATSPTPPVAAPLPPRTGAYREVGTVRHASIRAERYRLKGVGKTVGEFDVGEGSVQGTLSVGGNLTGESFDSDGTLEVAGEVRLTGPFVARGTTRLGAGLRCGSAVTKGLMKVAKGIRVDSLLHADGALEVGGDLEAGLFEPNGRFEVGGSIRARSVDGRFDKDSRADRIEATTVRLHPRVPLRLPVDVPMLRAKGALIVDRIEADTVDLEEVEVQYLKANSITLGRRCHVARLDGTVVRRDPTSHVGYESRTPPPPGLTR